MRDAPVRRQRIPVIARSFAVATAPWPTVWWAAVLLVLLPPMARAVGAQGLRSTGTSVALIAVKRADSLDRALQLNAARLLLDQVVPLPTGVTNADKVEVRLLGSADDAGTDRIAVRGVGGRLHMLDGDWTEVSPSDGLMLRWVASHKARREPQRRHVVYRISRVGDGPDVAARTIEAVLFRP